MDSLQGFQRGIHWPYCIDRSCPGCMPNLIESIPPTEKKLDLSLFLKQDPFSDIWRDMGC